MSQHVIILDDAEDELIDAQKWYEAQRSGLGQEFRSAIDEAMERLLEAPLAASPIGNLPSCITARRVLLNDFRILSCSLTPTRIFGINIRASAWRPGYWRERLNPYMSLDLSSPIQLTMRLGTQ